MTKKKQKTSVDASYLKSYTSAGAFLSVVVEKMLLQR